MSTSTLPRDRDTAMTRLYAWVMIIAVGLTVAFALFATRAEPQYSATAEILIGPTITPSGNYIQPSMPTEQRVATSAEVMSAAAAQLGATSKQPIGNLSVTVPVDTQVLVMTYTGDTPGAALSGAETFAQTYLKARNPKDPDKAVARLVSPPELPSTPVTTNYPVVLGAAVVGGLLIGFAVARTWDRVRGRIRTIDDAERCTDLDALALTPHLPLTSAYGEPRLRSGRPQLDSLAARVLGQVEGGERSSVLVTGATSECGSTAVAVLTALALARMGRVVVLVTADGEIVARMSRDPEHGTEGPSRDPWPDARAAKQDGLHLLSVGEWDGAGVATARLAELLPELHHRLPEALIIIDGPPAWCGSGMALRADKILLVVALGRCSRKSAAAAVQALDHCAEKMMGLVITPRRRHVRESLISVRSRASLGMSRIMVRLGPLPGASEPIPARWSPSGATPAARGTSGPKSWEDRRPVVSDSDRIVEVGRLHGPHPSDEPTSSVAS